MPITYHNVEPQQAVRNDLNGNIRAISGLSTCTCGCKYWYGDECADCGTGIAGNPDQADIPHYTMRNSMARLMQNVDDGDVTVPRSQWEQLQQERTALIAKLHKMERELL